MALLKINKFPQTMVKVIEPDGTIHETNQQNEFHDLRVQIKELQLKGCVVDFDGEIIPIDKDGRLPKWPKGLFTDWDDILDNLL